MSKLSTPVFTMALLHPRYWLTWLWFGVWALSSQLPYRLLVPVGKCLGAMMYAFAGRRRRIAERNIELCFPDLSDSEKNQRVKKHFAALGLSFFETGMVWFTPAARMEKRMHIDGLENIQSMLDQGEGILFLVPHFTTLEVLGLAIKCRVDKVDQTYRPHNNPVYDWVQSRCRERHSQSTTVLVARDVRGIVRSLKNGRRISFLPDQDYGRQNSIFAPFYGTPAATVSSMARLAQMSKVKVVPLMSLGKSDGSYQIKILPALDNFPLGDDMADAERVNQEVERCISYCPEQYLWTHRRFKTRPNPDEDLYQLPQSRSKQRRQERKRRARAEE